MCRKTRVNPTDRKWVAVIAVVDFIMALACLGFTFL